MTSGIRSHVIIVALVSALAGCAGLPGEDPGLDVAGAGPVEVASAIKVGEHALEQARYADALKEFERVLRQEPENERAKLGLAEAYLGLGAHARARALFEDVQDVPELRLRATQGVAMARLAQGEVDEAQAMLTELTAEDASLWRAWNALARSHDLQQAWDKAAEAYRQALSATSKPALIHNNWGMSLMAQGRHEEAAERFARALELDPSLDVAQTNLRLALAYQDRYAEALAGAEQDELPRTLNNVGYVALLRGDLARAEAYFLRALEASAAYYSPAARNLQLLGSMKQIKASAPAS